jgi:hypothetical protein
MERTPKKTTVTFFMISSLSVYSGETGHSFRFKTATDRSEATLDDHYTSLWPE